MCKARAESAAPSDTGGAQEEGAGARAGLGGFCGAPSTARAPAPCPRCHSQNTKFCYYNNYKVNQPRYFCRQCERHWTAGGSLRRVPVGAGRRKSKSRADRLAAAAQNGKPTTVAPVVPPPQQQLKRQRLSDGKAALRSASASPAPSAGAHATQMLASNLAALGQVAREHTSFEHAAADPCAPAAAAELEHAVPSVAVAAGVAGVDATGGAKSVHRAAPFCAGPFFPEASSMGMLSGALPWQYPADQQGGLRWEGAPATGGGGMPIGDEGSGPFWAGVRAPDGSGDPSYSWPVMWVSRGYPPGAGMQAAHPPGAIAQGAALANHWYAGVQVRMQPAIPPYNVQGSAPSSYHPEYPWMSPMHQMKQQQNMSAPGGSGQPYVVAGAPQPQYHPSC